MSLLEVISFALVTIVSLVRLYNTTIHILNFFLRKKKIGRWISHIILTETETKNRERKILQSGKFR